LGTRKDENRHPLQPIVLFHKSGDSAMGWTEYFQGRFFLLPEVQQIENAPCRSRRIDKSAGNAWDLSIPSEHFGKILYLLTVLNLSYKIGISALLPYY